MTPIKNKLNKKGIGKNINNTVKQTFVYRNAAVTLSNHLDPIMKPLAPGIYAGRTGVKLEEHDGSVMHVLSSNLKCVMLMQ